MNRTAVGLAALVLLLQHVACAAPPILMREEMYPTPFGTYGLTTGDFNGDGWLDIASTNFGTEFNGGRGVTVYLNQHGSGFSERADYLTGYRTFGITSADLNGDHRDDLAFATYYDNAISVMYANAAGSFSSRIDYSVAGSPFDVVTGDFNRDGRLDLAANHYNFSTFSGLPGGGFGNKQTINTGTSGYGNLVVADLDRDGNLDLAQTTGDGQTVQIVLGQSNGSFGPSQQVAVGPAADALAVGKLNGDGLLDLAVTNWELNRITTLLAQAGGGFAEQHTYFVNSTPQGLAIGDLDGDGIGDLAVLRSLNGFGALELFLGQPNGQLTLSRSISTFGSRKDVVIADFNKDGHLDVAVPASTSNTNGSSFSVFYQTIPEPTTLLTLAIGMIPLCASVRRRRVLLHVKQPIARRELSRNRPESKHLS